jgi:rubrerythrin
LKTGFNAEAASAARFRALAARAERESRPNVARRLRELAAEKDALALAQYDAAEAIREPHEDLSATVAAAVAEERYENDALYPRMIREVDDETAGVLRQVVSRQQEHAQRLSALLDAITSSSGDIPA